MSSQGHEEKEKQVSEAQENRGQDEELKESELDEVSGGGNWGGPVHFGPVNTTNNNYQPPIQ